MSKRKDSDFFRFVAATVGTITAIGYGAAMTWTSPSIPYLTSEKSPIPLSKEQSDIISSLLTVGYITGYIMNPFIIERFGSKRTLLIYTIPQMGSWILINFSKTPMTLYIARILAGIGYGAGICALTIYLSEIGTSRTRGIFISFLNLSMGLGFFLVMLLGAYISYRYMNFILLTSPIIFAATFPFMPDATYFSNENSKDQEMKIRLHSSANDTKKNCRIEEIKELKPKEIFYSKDDVSRKENFSTNNDYHTKEDPDTNNQFGQNEELCPKIEIDTNRDFDKKHEFGQKEELCPKENIQDLYLKDDLNMESSLFAKNLYNQDNFDLEEESKVDRDAKEREEKSNCFNIKETRFWRMIACRNSRKALIITVSLAGQDVLSGHMVVWTFTQQLLTSKGSPIDSEKATMFLAIAKIVASGISAQIIEKTGRRNILLFTSIIGTLANILVCGFFFLEEGNFDVSSFGWLPCVGLTTYEFFLSIGCSNFFYLYQAELFTSDVKSMGVMVCKVSYMAFSYFCLFRFQVIMAAIGKAMIYLMFSICSIVVSIFVLSITPETRGKSIDEIQMILRKKRFFVF